MNIEGFGFFNGFSCSDIHNFEKLNNLSVNIFELNFYQDQKKWRHKLIPFEVIKSESDRVIDLLNYKKNFVLMKKIHIFLGNHNRNYVCRRCSNSYTSQNVLNKHEQQPAEQDISSLRLSKESHLHWKNHFRKNPLYFRIYADFEADNEIANSSIGKKTTNIHRSKTQYLMRIT